MKKCILILIVLTFLSVLLGACAGNKPVESTAPSSTVSAAPAPSEPPVPDFAGTDFTGKWTVKSVTASDGSPATDAEVKGLGTDFVLEILKDGVYFVYDAKGKALGQGKYSILKNQLTLDAGDKQTVYEILDKDSIRTKAEDGSITVMSRSVESPDETENGADKSPAPSGS